MKRPLSDYYWVSLKIVQSYFLTPWRLFNDIACRDVD